MSDHTDLDRGLDDRIRGLVARAVADAPPAPVIDERTAAMAPVVRSIDAARSNRNRWIVGGLAGMTVAASVIALAFVARPDTAEAPAPGSVMPTGTPAPAVPSTTEPPAVGTAPPTSTAVPSTAASSVASTAPLPTAPPTPAPPLPPPTQPEIIVVAGDDGIQIDTGDAITDALTGESVQTAVRTADGSVWYQRDGDLLVLPSVGAESVPVPIPADFAGSPVLHDAAVVDGEVVLLVESTPAVPCAGGDGCIGSVWAVWPGRGDGVMLDEQNVWEAAWSRLSLSDTGVAVGMFSAEVSISPWSVALPGVDAAPVTAADAGLDEVYTDCSDCPYTLAIDRSGQYVGFLDRDANGDTVSISVRRLSDGWTLTYDLSDAADLPSFGWLDIGAIEIDGSTLVRGAAIWNDSDPTAPVGAHVYDLADSSNEPIVIGTVGTHMSFGL